MSETVGRILLRLSYALFLAAAVYAPAAYGLTRDSHLVVFLWLLGGTFAIWMAGHLILRTWPDTGVLPWLASGAVVLWGGAKVTAGFLVDRVAESAVPTAWLDLLAAIGSYAPESSLHAVLRAAILLGGMLMTIEIWRNPTWSRGLLLTLLGSAIGMVLLFLLQRMGGGLFQLRSEDGQNFLSFATFRYWGNAASYLNLLWPLFCALAAYGALRQSYGWTIWLSAFIAVYVSCFLNVSKAGNVLALIGLAVLAALLARIGGSDLRRLRRKIRLIHLLAVAVPLLIIATALPFAIPIARWEALIAAQQDQKYAGRLEAYANFLTMLPDSGWSGFGPGTFSQLYLGYVADDRVATGAYWVAHQDYLQTAVEWGYLGLVLWAAVMVPGGFNLLRRSLARPQPASFAFPGYHIHLLDHVRSFVRAIPDVREPWVASGAFVAVFLTALHAAADFPMQIGSLQFLTLVLLGLGWSYSGATGRPGEDPKDPRGDEDD